MSENIKLRLRSQKKSPNGKQNESPCEINLKKAILFESEIQEEKILLDQNEQYRELSKKIDEFKKKSAEDFQKVNGDLDNITKILMDIIDVQYSNSHTLSILNALNNL